MSLKDLTAEIEKIGDKKIKDLEKQLEERLKKIDEEYAEEKSTALSESQKRADSAVERVETRTEMLANTEKRKHILAKKREIVESVFTDALDNLVKSSNYKKYLEESLKKAKKEVKEGEIIPAKGKKEVTEEIIKGTDYKIVSEGDFKGGFVLRSGKIEYDFTFDSVIEKCLRDELETKIAHILF